MDCDCIFFAQFRIDLLGLGCGEGQDIYGREGRCFGVYKDVVFLPPMEI